MPKITQWWVIFISGLIPLGQLILLITFNQLGSNPIQAIHIYLGDWTLRFLCLSLAITPVKRIAYLKWLVSFRRMIGLYVFFYGTLHVLTYLVVDHALQWKMIFMDIIESPFIIMGVIAYFIILLMAITSTKVWQKRLGKTWKRLHQWVYVAGITAIIHYFWQLKGNLIEPIMYALIVGLLLSFRAVGWLKRNQNKKPSGFLTK